MLLRLCILSLILYVATDQDVPHETHKFKNDLSYISQDDVKNVAPDICTHRSFHNWDVSRVSHSLDNSLKFDA